jgi:hypothetical protein
MLHPSNDLSLNRSGNDSIRDVIKRVVTDLRRSCFVVAACAASLPAAAASPQVVNLSPAADTVIYFDAMAEQAMTGYSNAKGHNLSVGVDASGLWRRSLLRFDLSAIAPGATIHSAELTLFQNQARGAYDVGVHKLLTGWGEGASFGGVAGAHGTASAGDATWLHAQMPATAWSTPGGDFVAAASATTYVGLDRAFYSWSSATMAADVQSWVDGPAANHGWILIGLETRVQIAKIFASKEYSWFYPNGSTVPSEWEKLFHPVLTLHVTPVPEPGAFAMLAIGLGLVGWRHASRRARAV